MIDWTAKTTEQLMDTDRAIDAVMYRIAMFPQRGDDRLSQISLRDRREIRAELERRKAEVR